MYVLNAVSGCEAAQTGASRVPAGRSIFTTATQTAARTKQASIDTLMYQTRREALAQLAALAALPLTRWTTTASDPLDGTIAEYQAGRRRGDWSASDVTAPPPAGGGDT